jgi:hypothetical protein
VSSDITTLGSAGVDFAITVEDMGRLQFPLVQHAKQRAKAPQDPALRDKYLRLRKILTHFRSHSKGALAKYRDKIENPRVAGNRVGSAVLERLVRDGVLIIEGPLYFLDPNSLDELLGISWPELRKGGLSEKLLRYLTSIAV